MFDDQAQPQTQAQLIKRFMETNVRQMTERHPQDITGIALAWREGELKLIVQAADSTAISRLRNELPDYEGGYQIKIQVNTFAYPAPGSPAMSVPLRSAATVRWEQRFPWVRSLKHFFLREGKHPPIRPWPRERCSR
ncbi:MAG: hypothetical protein AB7G80_06665 [Dongiaceae bacterium]